MPSLMDILGRSINSLPLPPGQVPIPADGKMNGVGLGNAPMTLADAIAPRGGSAWPGGSAMTAPLMPSNGPTGQEIADMTATPLKRDNSLLAYGGVGRTVLGGLLDGVARHFNGQPGYAAGMDEQSRLADLMRQRAWQVQDRDFKASQPDYFTLGNNRMRLDPRTGQTQTVASVPEDFQTYAATLGLEPGSPEYALAVQDFVLRSSGPTALDGRMTLEDVQQGNRMDLEGVRQRNRVSLKGVPTYRDAHPTGGGSGGSGGAPRTYQAVIAPIMAKLAQGQPLTVSEQTALNAYQGRSGGNSGRKSGTSGPTATNPQTGEKVRWDGKAWVPAK